MCEYIKSRFPHIYLYTSTNGLALTPDRARRLVHSGIDEVTFSIDGASQATYERYRQRGNFEKAVANLRAMAEEKARAGRDVPFLNWRYILFTWNDGDEEMQRARTIAVDVGVDRLCWELTDHPEEAYSRRFVPGRPTWTSIRREVWDDNGLGNAIPGATPRARIDVRGGLPGLPLVVRTGRTVVVRTRVRNLSTRQFASRSSSGRRLVRLGAQLCAGDGTLLNRDYARAWLPGPLEPRRRRRRGDRGPRAVGRGPISPEVRPRERRHRLVRGLRISHHHARVSRRLVGRGESHILKDSTNLEIHRFGKADSIHLD